MPEKAIRFGVRTASGHRGATWKCWTPAAQSNELYLACRALRGELKASFHESGQWHIAFSQKFFEERFEEETRPSTRFTDRWPRPTAIAPGVTLAFRIVVPWFSATVPIGDPEPDIVWIPAAPEGRGIEVDVVITAPSCKVSSWPGKRSMDTELIGSLSLPNGDTVWLVYQVIEIKIPDPMHGTPRFFKGIDKTRLESKDLRGLFFGDEPDGSRVIYDVPVKVLAHTHDRLGQARLG